MKLYLRLLRLVKPHTPRFILAMICMAVVGAATAAAAYLVKPAMDDIFLDRNEGMLILIPVVVLVIYLLKGVCNYGQTVLMSHIGFRIVTDLRRDLYRQILRQPLSFFTKNPTGLLISRVTNDVTFLQGAVSEAVTSLLKDSFTLAALVFVIFWRDWQLAIIASLVFPLAVYPIAQFGRRMRRIATESQVSMGDLISLLQETITGNRIVKAFGMEEHENRRFAQENERQFKLAMKSVTVRAVSSPLMEFQGRRDRRHHLLRGLAGYRRDLDAGYLLLVSRGAAYALRAREAPHQRQQHHPARPRRRRTDLRGAGHGA